MTGDALTGARDRLHALEQQTPNLQGQADTEAQALTEAQDNARAGRAPLRLVVAAQGLADAAHGLLRRHLIDVEQQRGQVADLERSHAAAQLVERGRVAQVEADRAAQDAAAVVAQAEAAITEARAQFQALQQTHRNTRGQVWESARQHVAQALGITPADVGDAVNWGRQGNLRGQAGADRRAAVAQALSDFAAMIGTSDRELIVIANRAAPELSAGSLGTRPPL